MFFWEQAITGFLDGIGLRSIKSKIIVFALFATLLPSVTMGWISYRNNRRAVDEKTSQELTSLTSHASRELELWLRERQYEMRVLSSSYEVSENLARLSQPPAAQPSEANPLRRIREYLGSIGEKFSDYEELVIADAAGNVLASSRRPAGDGEAAADWLAHAPESEKTIGSAYWDRTLDAAVMVIVQPVSAPTGRILGTMAAKLNFSGIDLILGNYANDPSHELYVMTRGGEILISSRGHDAPFMSMKLPAGVAARLFEQKNDPLPYDDARGAEVLGSLRTIPDVEWGVVAQKDRAMAYAAIDELRNTTLAVIGSVLLLIGLAAYMLCHTIVGPLGRLTRGATLIAGGDLEVSLPHYGRSEVGYLTKVFNEMVERLRQFRDENAHINRALRERNDELKAQTETDSLTGLSNRSQLSELLAREALRSQAENRAFSVLMIDIDFFKRFNDTHGHPAGDEVLRIVAGIFRSFVRFRDAAARYGGEEFLILLAETGSEEALQTAERLRAKVAETRVMNDTSVTVSIGVASYPENGTDVETIIHQADAALYRCKRGGRNQVLAAMNVPTEASEAS